MIPGRPFHVAAVQVLLLTPRALVKYGEIDASASVSVIHIGPNLVNIVWLKSAGLYFVILKTAWMTTTSLYLRPGYIVATTHGQFNPDYLFPHRD